jgi:hypothetical protein
VAQLIKIVFSGLVSLALSSAGKLGLIKLFHQA